ncbi:serine hydrolase domain-containing protein [Spirosoma linguale]
MDSLFKGYNQSAGPGCAVAIIQNGQVIFSKGYGMGNLEYTIPVTSKTVFDVASLAKQFTGFAISTLVQEGKITLSDDIRKYLPELPRFAQTITIGHLVHHTSGIRDWPEALMAAGWRYSELCSFQDIMHMVKNQRELDFVPGTEESYSNSGYNILAALVEKVSGQTFPAWTSEHIFKPLQMTSTLFLDDNGRVIPNLAYSYYSNQDIFLKSTDVLTAYGSSSLYTSLEDMAKWVIHFQQALETKDPVFIRMLDTGKLNNGEKVSYGFGLETGTYNGYSTIVHTGAWAGYRTIIRNFPDEKLSVIILSNGDDNSINNQYMAKVVSLFLTDKTKPSTPVPTITSVKVNPERLKKYVGLYKWRPGEVHISLEKDTIRFQFIGEDSYPTIALNDSTFMLTVAGLPIVFHQSKGGAVNSFTFKDRLGKKFTPHSASADELKTYVGTYFSQELQAEYTVGIQANKLVVRHFRRGDFPMSSNMKDEFTGDLGVVRFIRNNRQQVRGFNLSGERVRNIYFDKKH